ncbi:hypothetical protein BGZ94_008396, partial [Podila epigama]
MALREENFVVLHSGSWNTRAGINVLDTNKPPSVTIRSLVGSRTVTVEASEEQSRKTDMDTSGTTATETSEMSEDVDIKSETEDKEKDKAEESTKASANDKQQQQKQQETEKSQTIYYCGAYLNEARQQYSETELTVTWPIEDGIVKDWAVMEALWHVYFPLFMLVPRHVLFKELGIKRSRNASPVLMVVPTDWTKEEHERITQIFFENFNVPGLYLAEEPLMTLYGCATVTGL